jgi:hypothetical protein
MRLCKFKEVSLFFNNFIDVKIRKEKLQLKDAIVIILAVSLSSLPNLIAPMLFGPVESKNNSI